ncbi:hypothetical protein DFH11DRAFT_1864282 [Phellopilus nigrolimitatus]|nr:hypothetical protein DFH11DRAFT_1864282 [Phellopilus nigrolimitatus]
MSTYSAGPSFCDLERGAPATSAFAAECDAKQSLQQKRGVLQRLKLDIPAASVPSTSGAPSPNDTVKPEACTRPGSHKGVYEAESNEARRRRRAWCWKWRWRWRWRCPFALPDLQWIPGNLNRLRLRPVLRCAISAWFSLLLVLFHRSQHVLGTASFLILIGMNVLFFISECCYIYAFEPATFLSPPSDPFVAVLEREIVVQLAVSGTYAWSCLGIKLANLARTEFNPAPELSDVIAGRYIETGPSIICFAFLCIGTAAMAYSRAKMGAGRPVIAAMILGFTSLDTSLTMAPLYPYANYQVGQTIVIPVAFHSAMAIFCSLFVLPDSVHVQFRERFHAVLTPLSVALRAQPALLRTSPHLPEFDAGVAEYTARVLAAEAALAPLTATRVLMKKDLSLGRFGAGDFKAMHALARRMAVRANGMAFYFRIMDPVRHAFPGTGGTTPIHSGPSSPPGTPHAHVHAHFGSNAASVSNSHSNSSASIASRRRRRHTTALPHYFSLPHAAHAHAHTPGHPHLGSLFHEVRARAPEHAVGAFESQAYLNLETRLAHAGADALRFRMTCLLGESAGALLGCAADALDHCTGWLQRVNDDRLWKRVWRGVRGRIRRRAGERMCEEVVLENEEVKARLKACLEEFRKTKRHIVLAMYRAAIDPNHFGSPSGEDPPPHRYLFQSFLYQYHLIHFVQDLIELLDEITRLESTRQHVRFWAPIDPLRKLFTWSRWDPLYNNAQPEDEEDPDVISGMEVEQPLGYASYRNPDALPPRNTLEAVGRALHDAISSLGHGNAVAAFKAGVMAGILSLPAFLARTAGFAVAERYVWCIVLGQTTISRFRGDTVFGLAARVLSTFFGGVVGMIMWYISTGTGRGNAFGLAAVAACCFPFFFFVRVHYPGPPINVAFFFLTSQLVIGYSWQDTHNPSISVAGWGYEVAYKRFILVTMGTTAAFITSFLPPSTTLRSYLRTAYATTAGQLGQLYCDIVSFATVRDRAKTEEIVANLAAVRMKLNRTRVLKRNVAFEFSLQGKWPADRYQRLLDIQTEIAYLLSHLRSVEEHLEPTWARAFLRRTRFMDADFQGDILSVICMISIALRTGTPLPQITPCPLLDRFVAHHDGQEDFGLPRALTIDTLENEQYLYFSVGVATAFGIVTRIDRLMLATKELVGEQYHIHGVMNLASKMPGKIYF